MNLKNQLRYYLEHRNITASHLARCSGVPKQSISDWLSGSNPRDIRQVKKVADFLSITVDHLVFGEGREPKPLAVTVSLPSKTGSKPHPADTDGDWSGGLFEVRFRRIKNPGG